MGKSLRGASWRQHRQENATGRTWRSGPWWDEGMCRAASVGEGGLALEVVRRVGDGHYHLFAEFLEGAVGHEGVHVGLELVIGGGGENLPAVAVVANVEGGLTEEAPALEVGEEVVAGEAAALHNPVEDVGHVVVPRRAVGLSDVLAPNGVGEELVELGDGAVLVVVLGSGDELILVVATALLDGGTAFLVGLAQGFVPVGGEVGEAVAGEVNIEHDEGAEGLADANLVDAEGAVLVDRDGIDGVILHLVDKGGVVGAPAYLGRTVVGSLTGTAVEGDAGEVVVDKVPARAGPVVDFVRLAVAHLHDVIVGVDIVGHLVDAFPAEVGVHLVLVAPLVAQTPDGVVVVVDQGVAVEHAALLVLMERHAHAALEHVVGVVDVGEGAVFGQAVVLGKAEYVVLPLDEGVDDVDVLAIALGTGDTLAVLVETFG